MTRDSVRTNACECSKISRVRGGREKKKRKERCVGGCVGKVDKFVLETNVKACGFKSHHP